MNTITTCPYCNAELGPLASVRAPCPRCGEMVDHPQGGSLLPEVPAPPDEATYRKPVEANRRVALVILTGMVVMAVVGLVYALYTMNTRREHDKNIPRSSRRPVLPPLTGKPEVLATAPGRLAGLAYLPDGCTVVAGVHVAELLEGPLGEELKGRTFQVGREEVSLARIEEWVGIPAGNIEHVVLGCVLEKGGSLQVPPVLALVVRTREPVGLNRLREVLKAERPRQGKSQDGQMIALEAVTVRGLPKELPVLLWVPTARTVVLAVGAEAGDLKARPAEGLDRVVAGLHPVFEERMGTDTVAWAVGHSAQWKRLVGLAALPWTKTLPLDDLTGVRTAAAWVPGQKPLRVQGVARFRDEEEAQRVEEQVKKAGRLKFGREGEWLSLQGSVEEE